MKGGRGDLQIIEDGKTGDFSFRLLCLGIDSSPLVWDWEDEIQRYKGHVSTSKDILFLVFHIVSDIGSPHDHNEVPFISDWRCRALFWILHNQRRKNIAAGA